MNVENRESGEIKDATEIIRSASRTFYYGSSMLPKSVRGDVRRLYAWCRLCDDHVDDPSPAQNEPNDQLATIAELAADIDRIANGQRPKLTESRYIEPVLTKHKIPPSLCLDLLAGMKSDVIQASIESEQELMLYCYQVAGTVGMMLCYIFDATNPAALTAGKNLGIAMQLTNMARDLHEDKALGRQYVPTEWQVDPTGSQSVKRLVALAEAYYRSGLGGVRYLKPSIRPGVMIAGMLYRRIGLKQISISERSRIQQAAANKARLSGLEMMSIGLETCCRTFLNSLFRTSLLPRSLR